MSILHLLLVATMLYFCHASPSYRDSYRSLDRLARNNAMCTKSSKPCRVQVTVGDVVSTSQACRCGQGDCPDDFDANSDKVLNVDLRTSGNVQMTYSMMFCTAFPDSIPLCASDNLQALRLSGYMALGNEVESYDCTCRDSRPLVLYKETVINFRTYFSYICANHTTVCASNESCIQFDSQGQTTTYPCQCPTDKVCRRDSSNNFSCQSS